MTTTKPSSKYPAGGRSYAEIPGEGLTGTRARKVRPRRWRECRNPKCREFTGRRFRICASCWAAGKMGLTSGVIVAYLAMLVFGLLKRWVS